MWSAHETPPNSSDRGHTRRSHDRAPAIEVAANEAVVEIPTPNVIAQHAPEIPAAIRTEELRVEKEEYGDVLLHTLEELLMLTEEDGHVCIAGLELCASRFATQIHAVCVTATLLLVGLEEHEA